MDPGTAAALGLGLPVLVDLALKYSHFISNCIQTYKHAKEDRADLETFGTVLAEGMWRKQFLLAKEIWSREDCTAPQRAALEVMISKTYFEIWNATRILENHSTDTTPGRLYYSVFGRRKIQRINDRLATHQSSLTELLGIIDLENQQLYGAISLDVDNWRYRQLPWPALQPLQVSTTLSIIEGEIKTGHTASPTKSPVLIEECTEISEEHELRKITEYLLYRFQKNVVGEEHMTGILPILGYKFHGVSQQFDGPKPQLIFKLPLPSSSATTLHRYIFDNPSVDLDFRFSLARKLASAVLSVSARGLVHKNIRTDSSLILQSEDRSTIDIFLTDWWLLGSYADFSTTGRAVSDWKKDIFRHPRRHKATQQRGIDLTANTGHDVYSLGVCLVEIGMWDRLVKPEADSHGSPISDDFIAAAGHSGPLQPGGISQIFSTPERVREALVLMAEEHLPSRMGRPFANLVKACLNCLDGGFTQNGKPVDFQRMTKEEQTLSFNELVLAPLSNVLPGFGAAMVTAPSNAVAGQAG
ncbi:hypothetical protein PLIIFM63780_010636 [Purpureocillium lilacinum]|nr:hypothetical protein PLIIFM63780_010563 [Purpureocillium lilacinum]GJN87054.1 hypothetical protein PLIIFM63780_010636 [Purpureocillium lilacinum]